LTDEDATLSRRQWREKHEPVVRYNRRIFDLDRSFVLPFALGTFLASAGWTRGGGMVAPEVSAWVVAGFCALAVVALVVDTARRIVAVWTAAFAATTSVLAATVVLGRNQGVVTASITAMLLTNGVGVLVGCLAIALAVRRRRLGDTQPRRGVEPRRG
jgi:hypothetical protein